MTENTLGGRIIQGCNVLANVIAPVAGVGALAGIIVYLYQVCAGERPLF